MKELNEELKIKTKKCYHKIMASIDPKGFIVDTLFAKQIITARQLKEMNGGPDSKTRAGNVLTHLFETSHPRAFVDFREALKEDYAWLVEMIGEYTSINNIVVFPEQFHRLMNA